MTDTVTPIPDRKIRWGRAIGAGVIATIVMTIVMMLMKMNLMKSLGTMVVGSNASPALQYAVGGAIHFMIGIIYGVIFAVVVGPVVGWNRALKGIVYGLAIAAIALAAMPVMAGAAKPPMNPCRTKQSSAAMNPCHPQAAMNPCHTAAAANPCNPCGGSGRGTYSGLMSVINHVVYGLTLAFVYGKVR